MINWSWRYTSGTPRKKVLSSVYNVQEIKDIEEESNLSDDSVHRTINMATQDTTTDTLLKYFTDTMPVAEDRVLRKRIVIAKVNYGSK